MGTTTEQLNVSATITAQNSFTDPLPLDIGEIASISFINTSSFTGTITLQRQLPGQTTWQDVPDPDGNFGWTAATEQSYASDERQLIRLGCKTGGYSSGTATVRLGKG